MDTGTLSGQIVIQVQKAIIESPSSSLIDQKWFIALLGSLSGVIVSLFITQLIDYLREKNKKGKILRGLLREIHFLVEYYKQQIPELKATLADIKNGKKISLLHAKQTYGENYNIYLSNFVFLEYKLDAEIYLFFSYFKLIDSASVEFGKISEKYRINDPSIKQENIIAMLTDIIDKTERAQLLGKTLIGKIAKFL